MPASIITAESTAIKINKYRGRPFGAKGKVSESIRWGIVEAYRQLGGVDGLVKWGRKNPDAFYPMLTKLLPAELAESGAGSQIKVIVYGVDQQVKQSIDITPASTQVTKAETEAETDQVVETPRETA